MKRARLSRGGRPRKEGDRYPSGKLRGRDGPTPELAAKRQQFVGEGNDPDMNSPLKKLLAIGLITQTQFDLADHYEECRLKAIGSPFAKVMDPTAAGGTGGGGTMSDAQAEAISTATASYLAMSKTLDQAGLRAPFEDVVILHLSSRVTGNAQKIKRREKRLLEAFKVLAATHRPPPAKKKRAIEDLVEA